MNPGDTVYYVCNSERIVVPSIIEEVTEIWIGEEDRTIWSYRYIDSSKDYVSYPTSKIGDDGFEIYEQKEYAATKNYKKVNEFLWIDEPVGHAVQLDDEVFATLSEAMKQVFPSRKKRLRVRLNRSRRRVQKFIARTWKMSGEAHPGFSKLKEKKVYVRKHHSGQKNGPPNWQYSRQ